MNKIITLVFAFSLLMYAQYTTPGTGVNWTPDSLKIYAPTVITGDFPNYSVVNKIIVAANDKVTILPGTTVTFTGSTSGFEVNGAFAAVGTETSKILLQASVADSTGGSFDGLRFNATAVDEQCTVKYAKVQYAYAGIRCIDASITVENCEFFKCARGFQLSTSNTTIRNNVINRCYEYGITMTLGSNPLIEGNLISENNTQNTSAKNQISIGLQGNNSPVIRNNRVFNSASIRSGGISVWVSGSASFSNAVIEGNTIYGNSFGLTLYSSGSGIVNARVANNLIYNNNINPDASVSGSGINVNGSPFNKPVITRNTVYGNHWGVTIQNGTSITAGPEPNLGNLTNPDTTDDGYNKIYNNLQTGQPFDLYNNCTNNVYAQNNDWAVYDSASIELKITHKVDDPAKGTVFYVPFFNPGTIPVEFKSFTGFVSGSDVKLRWEVLSERNCAGFELIRKSDYSGWERSGYVSGRGTSTEAYLYEFTDKAAGNSENLTYRLVQIDLDGTRHELSEINLVSGERSGDKLNFAIYPNPSKGNTTMLLSGIKNSIVKVELFNTAGEKVAEQLINSVTGASAAIKLSATNLSAGNYIIRVSDGKTSATGKLTLIK